MYIEGYFFYASLAGIVILLSYKSQIIRQYDKANQNHMYFDSFPRVRLWFIKKVHIISKLIKQRILKPFGRKIIKNIALIKQGAVRFVNDIRYGKRKLGEVIEKNGVASGYMQTIIEQKKKIRKKAHKRL